MSMKGDIDFQLSEAIERKIPTSEGGHMPDDYMNDLERLERLSIYSRKETGKQVGGTHYEDMGLQPLDATYMRYGYTGVKAALHCKIDKYIGRDKQDELADLNKAKHCIEMLIEYKEKDL
jgi:hypothetical protein